MVTACGGFRHLYRWASSWRDGDKGKISHFPTDSTIANQTTDTKDSHRTHRSALTLLAALAIGLSVAMAVRWQRPLRRDQHSGQPSRLIVNINTADEDTLHLLPGIGPQLAHRIVTYRVEHGPFKSVAEIQQVRGIGPHTLKRLKPLVSCTSEQ